MAKYAQDLRAMDKAKKEEQERKSKQEEEQHRPRYNLRPRNSEQREGHPGRS